MVIHHNGIKKTKQHKSNRDDSSMVSKMRNKVNEPIYNDYFSGLGICVDGVNYKYTLHFTMYDIFGLDSSDITDNYISFAPLWHTCWF